MSQEDALADYGTKTSEDTVQDKTYVIFGSNGNWIIEKILKDLGWKSLPDKYSQNFTLQWVESRLSVKYDSFKEDKQLINRIPNCYMLTNKLGLLVNLHKFQAACKNGEYADVPLFNLSDFFPETYRIDDDRDRKFFVQRFRPGEVWISKPIGLNQGRGIYLVRDIDVYKEQVKDTDREAGGCRLIQKYITNPLLMDGKKFDLRVYMLIASTKPYLTLFRKGYARLSLHKYNSNSEDVAVHLTNQFIQRKCLFYDSYKNETICSYERFNAYINKYVAQEKKLEQDWAHKTLWNRMKEIALLAFLSVKDKFKTKVGYFDLYGLDFIIDEDMKIWLLEVNVNPCFATNCDHLRVLIPDVIQETIHIALECFRNNQQRKSLLPLASQRQFEVIHYDGAHKHSNFGHHPLQKTPVNQSQVAVNPVSFTLATVQPKKNIISVVFQQEKADQKETKSMFETVKKTSSQEKRTVTSVSKKEDYDGDEEFCNEREKEARQMNSKDSSDSRQQKKSAATPSSSSFPSNSSSPRQQDAKISGKDENLQRESHQSGDKALELYASPEELPRVALKYTRAKLDLVEHEEEEREEPIQRMVKTQAKKASNTGGAAAKGNQAVKEGGSIKFENSRLNPEKDVGQARNRSFLKGIHQRTPRATATSSNTTRYRLINLTHQNSRDQQGMNHIAANKLLIQTLTKMNAEKKVKTLQSKFCDNSLPNSGHQQSRDLNNSGRSSWKRIPPAGK